MAGKYNKRHPERSRSRYNRTGADRYGTYDAGKQRTPDKINGRVSQQFTTGTWRDK